MTSLSTQLQEAIRLREIGEKERARTLLLELATAYPDEAQVQYQCAWVHDSLGLEREAVPYYERALALGLDAADGQGAYLGLGSTYRALGKYGKAIETLRQGLTAYPEDRSLETFLAMALYNTGRHRDAVRILLQHLAETSADPDIRRYQNALLFYADRLDETWA